MELIQELISKIIKLNPLQENFLSHCFDNLTEAELSEFEVLLHYYLNSGYTLVQLAQAYNLIVEDTLSEQIYFKRNKRYRYSSFKEVENSVYLSKDYMSKYMIGLALTQYFWPNHTLLRRFFEKTIPKSHVGTYLEVGSGHGHQILFTLKNTKYSDITVVDISPTSLELTRGVLSHFGITDNQYKSELNDFLKYNNHEQFDVIVMGEVLEHVEKPDEFLKKIKELTHSNSYIYVSTCINAPAVDHIYLFESVEQLKDMIVQSGLIIKDQCLIPYIGKSIEECLEKKLAINIGYVLSNE